MYLSDIMAFFFPAHPTSGPPPKEPSAETLKSPPRPPKPNHGVDIMSCQDKQVDSIPPKSKETAIDQRKKRIIAEPKTSHSRQSAASDAKLRANPQSASRRAVKSEAAAPNAAAHDDGDDADKQPVNSAEADGDFEDVDSSSDDESISSGCSSNGSHGEGLGPQRLVLGDRM